MRIGLVIQTETFVGILARRNACRNRISYQRNCLVSVLFHVEGFILGTIQKALACANIHKFMILCNELYKKGLHLSR